MKHTCVRTCCCSALTAASLCCVALPAGAAGPSARPLFPTQAEGSLVDAKGRRQDRVVGSRLIAQPFTGDEYFRPRPSAASLQRGGLRRVSNWGANNPKLRDRVAQQLGPIVVYKDGSRSAGTGPAAATPQQDIEAWFAAKPDRAADWAGEYVASAAADWAKTDSRRRTSTASRASTSSRGRRTTRRWSTSGRRRTPTRPTSRSRKTWSRPFFASFAKVHPGQVAGRGRGRRSRTRHGPKGSSRSSSGRGDPRQLLRPVAAGPGERGRRSRTWNRCRRTW